MTTTHSKYSPSSSNRWLLCPGSLTLDNPNAIQPVNEAAVFGTIVHELVEKWGNSGVLPENQEWTDNVEVPSGGWVFGTPHPAKLPTVITKEHIDSANECIDYLISMGVDMSTMYELHIRFDEYAPDGYGTADIVMINHETKTCHIMDIKTGQIRVSAENNSQLMIYALGVMLKFRLDKSYKYNLGIIQPKLHNYDTCEVSTAELLKFGETVRKAVKESLKKKPKRVVSSECTFCPNLTTCKEYKGFITNLFDNLDKEKDDINFNIKVIKLKATIINYIKTLEQKAFDSLSNNESEYNKDFKLDRSITKRKWGDSATQRLFNELGEAVYTKELIGITVATKLLSKKLNKKQAEKIVSEITIRPESKLVLKLIDDKNVLNDNYFDDLGE